LWSVVRGGGISDRRIKGSVLIEWSEAFMRKRTLEKRDIPGALLAGARWLMNPVSEGGAKQVPRIKMLAGGPEILADVERMRVHASGRRLLAQKPDLGVALSDTAALKSMPQGSLGRTFFKAMDNPYGVPGYLLAGLIYRDGFFDSFEMSDDARYYLERARWLHDLFHVVSGYEPNLAGEGLLIYFQQAYLYGVSYEALASSPLGLGPRYFIHASCGAKRWQALLKEAHAQGLAAHAVCPAIFVAWEDLLPQPLDNVRAQLGIVPFLEDTSRWLDRSWLGKQAAGGFGAQSSGATRAKLARRVVEAGVDYRDFYRLSAAKARALLDLAANGASDEDIRSAASV
jgi:ubiquinone biosynthesis protein COQ4